MRGAVQSSVETVNAAAAIVAAQRQAAPATATRRRWWSRFSAYLCFRPPRVTDAAVSPEPLPPTAPGLQVARSVINPALPALPFVVPPSSPASSFLTSGPSSAMHSPTVPPPLPALLASAYSPGGPASIFSIGPYAHETQLVTPPVFSTFPTEPSTAPLTPQPEFAHLTNPSSPEVPFARFVASSFTPATDGGDLFRSYHLHPGSPIGQLVSPTSICSSTSSPPPMPVREPPRILGPEQIALRMMIPRSPKAGTHRPATASFHLVGEAARDISLRKDADEMERLAAHVDDAIDDGGLHVERMPSLKEFNFTNFDGGGGGGAGRWWSDEARDGLLSKSGRNWPFFPMKEASQAPNK